MFGIAAENNRANILDWLYDDEIRTYEIFGYPVKKNGNLRCLTSDFTIEFMENAAEKGNVDVLKWARSRSLPWNERICAAAARIRMSAPGTYSSLDTLKWIKNVGCPWDHNTCSDAVLYENIETDGEGTIRWKMISFTNFHFFFPKKNEI